MDVPLASPSTSPAPASVDADLSVQTVRRRLRILTLLAIGAFLLGAVLSLAIPQLIDDGTPTTWPLFYLCLGMIAFSGGVLVLTQYLPSAWLAVFAHIYVIVSAVLMAITEVIVVPASHSDISGVSGICLWIVLFPLIIGSRPLPTLFTALMCASSLPAALLMVPLPSEHLLSPGHLVEWFLPGYFCAGLAWLASTSISNLSDSLMAARRKIRELSGYELVEKLAEGGMGEVWIARHRFLPQRAVMKFIALQAGERFDPRDLHERFIIEAQALASLRSPHCISIYDYGVTEEGRFYYVMEYLAGVDLEQIVIRTGVVALPRCIAVLLGIARALVAIHAAGLVHRDIKPDNIMLCLVPGSGDLVKVIDFGLAEVGQPAVDPDFVMGTPGYLAPELLMGTAEAGSASDCYSFACVAHYLLTGMRLFEGAEDLSLAHLTEAPPAYPPTVPAALAALIHACLAKHPSERLRDAEQIVDRLVELQAELPWRDAEASAWWQRMQPRLPDSEGQLGVTPFRTPQHRTAIHR